MRASPAKLSAKRSGVYRAPRGVIGLSNLARAHGLVWMDIPLRNITNKRQFLSACARQLEFPASFGGNWDALADSVRDLSWLDAEGYVLHLRGVAGFAKAAPDDYATALEVLKLAAEYWREQRVPFFALVDGERGLPAF